MSDEIKIPFGYKRVVGTPESPLQIRRGDGYWDGMKFVPMRRYKRKWPTVSEPGVIIIRRAVVEQVELPGV